MNEHDDVIEIPSEAPNSGVYNPHYVRYEDRPRSTRDRWRNHVVSFLDNANPDAKAVSFRRHIKRHRLRFERAAQPVPAAIRARAIARRDRPEQAGEGFRADKERRRLQRQAREENAIVAAVARFVSDTKKGRAA